MEPTNAPFSNRASRRAHTKRRCRRIVGTRKYAILIRLIRRSNDPKYLFREGGR